MKLLAITDEEPPLGEFFEKGDTVRLDQVAPQVRNQTPGVKVEGEPVEKYDAVFSEIEPKNLVFGRVLLEMLEEKGLKTDISSTAFFTASKKNYLYYVLKQKNVEAPKTVSIASEKAIRGIERQIKGPLIARRFEEMQEMETKKLDTVEAIQGFAEGFEYGNGFILFQEYSSGDKTRCLKLGDKMISLSESSDGWAFTAENLKYSNISSEKEEAVESVAGALGADILEVKLRGTEVFDVEPNPDFSIYEKKSGQDVYGKVAEMLKEGTE